MARVTVYEKETGKAHEVDSVDAKEYVASGGYTTENPNAGSEQAEQEAKPDSEQVDGDEAARAQREAATTVAPKASRKK